MKKRKGKNKELGKRVLRPWMTVVGAVGVVGVVIGATGLGVFLTGGFNEKVINPESISFSYDESLFNDAYSQLEITNSAQTGEFSLVITSPTEDVTEKDVYLSFNVEDGITAAGGYISNTIIQVPQVVQIGQPFSVKLLTEILKDEEGNAITDEHGNEIDWIKGGISTLIGTSENDDANPTQLKIAVDTPVYSTQTVAIDSAGQEIATDATSGDFLLLTGEVFTLQSKFIPAKSEYMYADDSAENNISEENRRKKHSFFEPDLSAAANAITLDGHANKYEVSFKAANREVQNSIGINSYTFMYADQELAFVEENKALSDAQFYEKALASIPALPTGKCKVGASANISPANITSFTIDTGKISLTYGKTTRLYLNAYDVEPDKPFIGASVLSNSRELDNMFANIGIRFVYQNGDNWEDAVEAGKVSLSSACKLMQYNGNSYYLPNSDVANIRYGYWDIAACDAPTNPKDLDIRMEMVLFTDIDTPKVYQSGGHDVVLEKTLQLTERENYEISWKDESNINITLAYNNNAFEPYAINLDNLVTYPKGKSPAFFVEVLNGDIDEVIGATSYHGQITINGKNMYALRSSSITLNTTGAFNVYFATINPDKTYNEDNYIELLCDEVKYISCKEALYQESVLGATIELPGSTPTAQVTEYKNYVGQKDASGDDILFTVKFEIAEASYSSFKQAFEDDDEFNVKLFDRAGNDVTYYFEMSKREVKEEEVEGTEHYYYILTYSLKDNALIADDFEGDDSTGKISTALVARTELVYNDQLTWGGASKDEFTFENKLYVYNAVAHQITSTSEVDVSGIKVTQKLGTGGTFETEVVYTINGTAPANKTRETFIENLKQGVVVKDQHENEESLAGQWKFVTNNINAISIDDNGYGFIFKNADGETATIEIRSLDGKVGTGEVYTLTLTTTGIQSIKYDSDVSGDCDAYSETISSAHASTNGAKDESVTLANLIEFYIDKENAAVANSPSQKYTKEVKYSISTSMLAAMSVQQKKDLFGYYYYDETNGYQEVYGWATLTSVGGAIYYIESVNESIDGEIEKQGSFATDVDVNGKLTLADTTNIVSIAFKHNFAEQSVLMFDAVAPGIKTTLTLTINPCTSIVGEKAYTLYAGYTYKINDQDDSESTKEITNKIKVDNIEQSELLAAYSNHYIIKSGTHYIVSSTDQDSVGRITSSGIMFNDFWDEAQQDFTVHFSPEGDNYYGLAYSITFTVLRNVKVESKKVESKNKDFVIYDGGITQDVSDFVSISRIKLTKTTEGDTTYTTVGNITYTTTNSFLSISVDNKYTYLIRNSNPLRITAGNDYPTETLSVYINNEFIKEITIKVKPVNNIYEYISSGFTGIPTEQQEIAGVKYIVIDAISADNSTWTKPCASMLRRDVSAGYETPLYTIGAANSFKPASTSAVIGLGEVEYLIVKFEDAKNGNVEWVYVPAIVSNVGIEPIEYIKYKDGTTELEVALKSPEELLAEGEFDIYAAGGSYTLKNASLKVPSIDKVELQYNIELYASENADNLYFNRDIVKSIDVDDGIITLNSLADNENEDVYVAIKFTLTSVKAHQQVFYYLMKIEPNIHLSTNYPYGGTYENLTELEGVIDLDEVFDDKTLATGEQRFNTAYFATYDSTITDLKIISAKKNDELLLTVEKGGEQYYYTFTAPTDINNTSVPMSLINFATASGAGLTLTNGDIIYVDIQNSNFSFSYGNQVFAPATYADEVVQVTINDSDVLTSADKWEEYITFNLDNDSHNLSYSYTAKEIKPTKFVVRRTYTDVVNGSIDYVFAINDDAVEYSIRFVKDLGDNPATSATIESNFEYGEIVTLPDELGKIIYNVPFRNGDSSVAGFDTATNTYTGLKVFLIENAVTGNAESGNKVYEILKIQLADVEGDAVDEQNIKAMNKNEDVYDNTQDAGGQFTLTLPDYLKQDTKITFVAFTSYGYSASLVFDIKANAEVELNVPYKDTKQINGGQTSIAFSDIYEVKLDGVTPTSCEVEALTVEELKKDKWETGSALVGLVDTANIKTQDVATDRTVRLTLTLKFDGDSNKTYTFVEIFTLKANVKLAIEAQSNENEIIAGADVTVSVDDFFLTKPTNLGKAEGFTVTSLSTSSAFNGYAYDDNSKTLTLKTNYVSEKTDVTVDVTFTLNSGEVVSTTYKFTVAPAVKIKTNYPAPESDGSALTMEYLVENTTAKMSYGTFFSAKAPFASSARTAVYKGEVKTDDTEVSYEAAETSISDFEVYLTSLSNAEMHGADCSCSGTCTCTFAKLSIDDKITDKTVKFIRGDTATAPAKVVLTVEYKGVSQTYTIYVSDQLYMAEGNFVTNNTSMAEHESSDVTAETIYVDRTNSNGIFADDRMAKVNISSSASVGEYYLVFADTTEEEKTLDATSNTYSVSSLPVGSTVKFVAENAGMKFTYNGITQTNNAEFTVVEGETDVTVNGVNGDKYIASYYNQFFASYPLYIKETDIGKTRTIDLGLSMSGKTFYGAISAARAESENVSFATNRLMRITKSIASGTKTDNLTQPDLDKFTSSVIASASLTNRVQLYYGETINKYAVASDKFYIDNSYTLSGTRGQVTFKEVELKLLDTDLTSLTSKATFNYYYIPDIDITISAEAEASAAGNYMTLEASEEYTSASQLFGIKHPTTGQYLSPADGSMISTFTFEVVDDANARSLAFYNAYKQYQPTETEFFKSTTSGGLQYLYHAQVTNNSKQTYDFRMIPQGAKNDGDFVLIKITYGVGSFTREFYIVVKIMPDYNVSFGGNVGKTVDGVLSNVDNPFVIKDITGTSYEKFTLAGENTKYLSIKHANGNNTSKEVSVSAFDISMDTSDGQYNNTTNINSKMSSSLADWTLAFGKYTLKTAATSITFENVKEVVFGDQYYVIDGEDDFGFKYQLYFTLQSTGSLPVANAELNITECEHFDIGLQYQYISETEENVSAESRSPVPGADYKLILLSGIEAYLTDQELETINESSPYYEMPDMKYVSIESLQVVDTNNIDNILTPVHETLTPDYDIDDDGNDDGYFATNGGLEWKITDESTTPPTTDTYTARGGAQVWQMPRLNGNAYGGVNVAKVTILIKLKYEKDASNVEIYTLKVNANVTRQEQIDVETKNNVIDGVAFDVDEHINSMQPTTTYKYINDTLEVLVQPYQIAQFTLTMGSKSVVVSLSNTGNAAYTTKYISLSEKFGINVQTGYTVTISNVENVKAFYYVGWDDDNDKIKNNTTALLKVDDKYTFTIGNIVQDVIYLENANLLNGDNIADVTKYYVVKYTANSTDYYYRVARTYQVTAQYYQIEKNYTGTVATVISETANNETRIPFSDWQDAFNLKTLTINDDGTKGTEDVTATSVSATNLHFKVVNDGNSFVGKVQEITSDGTIMLNESLMLDEYIKLQAYFVVSGADRNISNVAGDGNEDYVYFNLEEAGEINIGLG